MEFEKDENFEIELFDPEGGAKIGKVNRTAVTITNDDGKCNCCLDVCNIVIIYLDLLIQFLLNFIFVQNVTLKLF